MLVFPGKERCKLIQQKTREINVRGSVHLNVSSWDRVKEFKDQCLTVVSGNVRSDACKGTLKEVSKDNGIKVIP